MYIGAHIKKESTLLKTLEIIKENGGNALQLFSSNPRSANVPNFEAYKVISQQIKKYNNENNISMVIHSPYTINLAKEPKDGKRYLELEDCYWVKLLLAELIVSDMIGSIGVVVHVGKHTTQTKEEGTKQMFKTMQYITQQIQKQKIKSKLILETPAGAGTELLTNVSEFMTFYNQFSAVDKKHLGICLDTAHIWSSGYDINEYYRLISKENSNDILVIHFNNSKKNKGSHVDTHDNIFDGKIPLEDLELFLRNLKNNPVIILEKPSVKLNQDINWILQIMSNYTNRKEK